jgi:hypothetical protein
MAIGPPGAPEPMHMNSTLAWERSNARLLRHEVFAPVFANLSSNIRATNASVTGNVNTEPNYWFLSDPTIKHLVSLPNTRDSCSVRL